MVLCVLDKIVECAKKQARARVLLNRNFFLGLDKSVLRKLIVNKKGPPFKISLWDKEWIFALDKILQDKMKDIFYI